MNFDANTQRESVKRLARRALLKTTGIGMGTLAFGLPATTATTAQMSIQRLQTNGRWIEDRDGNSVTLLGIAPADPGFYELYHPKSATEVLEWTMDPGRGWLPNAVRLPFTQDSVEESVAVGADEEAEISVALDEIIEDD
ncbi:hypothetical protein [Halostagnicola sp. A-GB9-2]|uniref:hypothetical protein n=1 Tax=Halostagnicola sp. A-GB9-2 TaxID=3048066 RepID=UPI0024BFCC73|nr:hypothetical protein [Halostagnicola sp. A-GB9-2]MDJ1433672.1 hypothetical protein [Halostagnicola sp. A-GB9-2]